MTTRTTQDEARIELIRRYFSLVDAGDPAVLDLFTTDAQLFFPKFGVTHGKQGAGRLLTTLQGYVGQFSHDRDALTFIIEGDRIAVEGREAGTMHNGDPWPDGVISQGLFCNIFEFDGELVSRLHIYADPDFASADVERVRLLHPPLPAPN